MSYKRIKDRKKLVADCRVICTQARPHYFDIYLWEDQESFLKNTIDMDEYTQGCCELASVLLDPESGFSIPPRKLGEVHFIKDKWDEEVVAHELCHALLHRLRELCPSIRSVMKQEKNYEEEICYEFGMWNKQVYRWLWLHNPNTNYERKK